jgi:hypothetical protein
MPRNKVIKQLSETMDATLPYFSKPQNVLEQRYDTKDSSVREILIRLSDMDLVRLDWLRRLALDKKPTLQPYHPSSSVKLCYKQRNMDLVGLQFETTRKSVIELAQLLPDDVDLHSGIHPQKGIVSFGQTLADIVSANTHELHHLKTLCGIAEGTIVQHH